MVETQRLEVFFSGRVQGVGFRFMTHALAQDHDVRGAVRNLSDGRVHVVVEGEREEIERFLSAVERTLADYISSREAVWGEAEGSCEDFRIAF